MRMRTLDDIVPPSRRPAPAEGMNMNQPPSPLGAPPPASPPQRPLRVAPRFRFPWGTAIIALIIIVAVVAALFYFSKAEVDLTPNSTASSAAGSYTATVSGALPFEIITANETTSQTVPSTGSQTVTQSAKGVIIISNTQSKPQTLVATTRFETPTGLVYRIHSPVTIPAAGSANATVYADQPGAGYNIAPTSFTVPGFANTPQFNEVTAKSSGSMTGGASGSVPTVAPAIAEAAENSLAGSLSSALSSALTAKVPAGYVLLSGAATTSYAANNPTAASSTGMAMVSETGTISAVVFPNTALAGAIAAANQGGYDGEPATIQNPSSIVLSPSAGFPGASDQTFTFTLSGSANLLATINTDQIAAAVAGKTRQAAQVALTNFPAIKQAVLILRPFWKTAFPADPSRVKIIVESPS